MRPSMVRGSAAILVLVAAALHTSATAADAGSSLVDGNSRTFTYTESPRAMEEWYVDGVNLMGRHQFYYRIGPDGPEATVDKISAPNDVVHTAASDTTTYENAVLRLTFDRTLV